MGSVIRHAGTWTIEDMMASPWHYLPVEVPAGAAALLVTLSYSRDGGAILDLGCFGPSGFGGWSGGARSSFVISAAGATPGYLPGEVAAGLWQVAIGLYKVPAEGVRYEVTAEAIGGAGWARRVAEALAADGVGSLVPAVPGVAGERPGRRSLPAGPGRTWLAGDLHSHTVHSDGSATVPELALLAVGRGLDFVAVTDHNTVSHHRELAAASAAYGITLVPGQEVTTSRGHAGVLGDTGWIDFRMPADSWLAAAERGGGLMSINHPFGGDVSWLHPMERRPPLLEVWHWSWLDPTWTTPLSWWQAWDPSAIPVGGSDWHRPGSDSPLGTPTTWVECDDDSGLPGVLDGLRAGRVAITASRNGPILVRHDGGFTAIGADGLLVADPDGPYRRISGDVARLPGRPGYHRLVTPLGATVALTA
ncbi:MAG TPA: CehA/McbA family metallohydrolase [Trebonia sp.]